MSPLLQPYCTVSRQAAIELSIQKSRFIGQCTPVETESAALALLAVAKKRYWDASHNCFAYAIGANMDMARYSDDGEPGGTAGLPIMEAVKHKAITNVLVVVTRYFGGILLGAGGLVRAYSRAASDALHAAGPVWMLPCDVYRVSMNYSQWNALECFFRQYGTIQDIQYAETVSIRLAVERSKCEAFLAACAQKTDGQIEAIKQGEEYGRVPLKLDEK